MTKRQKVRVEKWISYLESLNPEYFNIKLYANTNDIKELREHHCGTAACAAGYLPVIFPRSWQFDKCQMPILKNLSGKEAHTTLMLQSYFGLLHSDVCRIIFHSEYYEEASNITPKIVANRIRKIMKKYDK